MIIDAWIVWWLGLQIQIFGKIEFLEEFKIINPYKKIGYNMNVMRHTACMVVNPITIDGFASLFSCTMVSRSSD